MSGYHRGKYSSGWFPTNGWFQVMLVSDGANCAPSGCGGGGWTYSGVSARDYSYMRYQSGASPWFPQLRAPGQWVDQETELFQNWNRFYDPSTARYFSPEPLLQKPQAVSDALLAGSPMPAYSYAGNDSINKFDRDGNRIRVRKQVDTDWNFPVPCRYDVRAGGATCAIVKSWKKSKACRPSPNHCGFGFDIELLVYIGTVWNPRLPLGGDAYSAGDPPTMTLESHEWNHRRDFSYGYDEFVVNNEIPSEHFETWPACEVARKKVEADLKNYHIMLNGDTRMWRDHYEFE